MLDNGILRVIDANFNRGKEGLRVVEDIFRFVLPNETLRKKTRCLRHSLSEAVEKKILKKAVLCRNSRQDPGYKVDSLELKRSNIHNILYANLQRAKESLRVLEEFLKLGNKSKVARLKKIRYQAYELEREIIQLRPALRSSRLRCNQRSKA